MVIITAIKKRRVNWAFGNSACTAWEVETAARLPVVRYRAPAVPIYFLFYFVVACQLMTEDAFAADDCSASLTAFENKQRIPDGAPQRATANTVYI